MPRTNPPFPTPRPGSLTDEALQRGRQYRRRRLVATRGATGGALVVVVAVAIALRVGGTAAPHVVSGHHGSTTTSPTSSVPSSLPTTTVATVTTVTSLPPTTVVGTTLPATTALHVVNAWSSSSTISSQVTVGKTISGSCWGGSAVVAEPSAWRCIDGNLIYDPCISPPSAAATATEVVCLATPWSDAVVMRLTSPLPLSSGSTSSGGSSKPWALELANGQRCVAGGGAVLSIDNVALYYACTSAGGSAGSGGGAGGIDTSHEPWTAQFSPVGSTSLTLERVTGSWTVASTPAGPAGGSTASAGAKWDAPQLLLTTTSLGAVKAGMTTAQAEAAGGEKLIPIGDGMYANEKVVNNAYVTVGDPGLEASVNSAKSGNSGNVVTYFCAFGPATAHGAPVVTTPEGWTVGGDLASLQAVYGSKLVYVPARTGGINPSAAYTVSEDGGTFVFYPSGTSGSSLVNMVQAGPGATAGQPC